MRKSRVFIALVALLMASPLGAQEPVGTIVVTRGGGPDWNAQVRAVAAQAKTGGPVEVSFLTGMEAPTTRFQDVARKLVEQGVSEIIVVPLLVSRYSDQFDQIRYLVGEVETLPTSSLELLRRAGIEPAKVPVRLTLTAAIDDSPDVARILAERALALAEEPREQALFLLAKGLRSTEEYAQWMDHLRVLADTVQALTLFRDVKVGVLLDGAAETVFLRDEGAHRIREIMSLQYGMTGREVVVVPVFLASVNSIPGALTKAGNTTQMPAITYNRDGLLTHPGLARWIETRVREGVQGRDHSKHAADNKRRMLFRRPVGSGHDSHD